MALMQLVYASRPFGYDELELANILLSARRHNARDGITGSLICREDLYLQMLEGEAAMVRAAYERIKRDGRHTDVALLSEADVSARLFGQWAMRHDPARSWMWTADAVAGGAVARASVEEVTAVFARLAETDPLEQCPVKH